MELKYIVTNGIYKNINDILIHEFKMSNRLILKLIHKKLIYLNGNYSDTRNSVSLGDTISINMDFDEDNSNIIATKMDLNILYEDEWFMVLDKPAKIAIHPSILHYDTSLSNGIKYYFDSIGLHKKIRPVNRLDSNTSGVTIFAKCEYIQEQFSRQMKEHIFKKEYLCLAEGVFNKKKGSINLPIARKAGSIIERCIDKNGQTSITHYEVLKEFNNQFGSYSLVKCILETGRTHQIRVHLSAIGHPLICDTLYGTQNESTSSKSAHLFIDRQALHSHKITLIHPVTKKEMTFSSDLPSDMCLLLAYTF